ncbi:hypothetical protein HD806DRAFT_552255 [Xylariaceae sp. AK1471]|nr:hypothetical protein HD806DRAFT_552255 [Xylariaceae sp. AK1471]
MDSSSITGEGSVATITVTATGEVGEPVQGTGLQTVTPALTTIFTPPSLCKNRYYVEVLTKSIATDQGISSGISDRLYRSCQPDPEAYQNYYSPGACPYLMNIAAVSSITPSSAPNGTSAALLLAKDQAHVWILDTNKRGLFNSGFVWDFNRCYSIVSTTTTVLIAKYVITTDAFIAVSQIHAWHDPIMAIWQTTDLSLFPSEVGRQKASIAKYGLDAFSTSSVALTPTESSKPPSTQAQTSTERALSTGAIVGIVLAVLSFVCFSIALVCLYRRRRRRRDRPSELDAVGTGIRKSWLGNAWRAELSSPAPTSQIPDNEANRLEYTEPQRGGDRQHEEKEMPVELDGGSAFSPLDGYGSQGRQSIVSPTSDRVVSFNPGP